MGDYTASNLAQEATAARSLIAELQSDDTDLNHDMVEGETGLMEAIDAALSEIDGCDVIIEGCKAVEGRTKERRDKFSKRQERLRGLIEQALLVAGLDGAKRPTATISVRKVKPKPVVTDESAIPSDFWKQPDPVLDHKKINSAADPIPGVTMSNGGTSLQIRRV